MTRPAPEERTLEACLSAYRDHLRDADHTSKAWRAIFAELDDDALDWLDARLAGGTEQRFPGASGGARDAIGAMRFIRAFRLRGHLEANLDPLRLAARSPHAELSPAGYGFGESDLDRPIDLGGVLGLESASVREIEQRLRRAYCGTLAIEYMHLQDPEQVGWIRDQFETTPNTTPKAEQRKTLLHHLTAAEGFERFLDAKWKGAKRFGLDGGESAIPALEQILREGATMGLDEVVIGMPHRGRLSVLANVMGKPLDAIFAEFRGLATLADDTAGSGDVKYHLGTSLGSRSLRRPPGSPLPGAQPLPSGGRRTRSSMGKVRARQDQQGDEDRKRVLWGSCCTGTPPSPVKALVGEVLQMSELDGYRTGGTIHLIVNNQIGFTTSPVAARSGPVLLGRRDVGASPDPPRERRRSGGGRPRGHDRPRRSASDSGATS